MSSVSTGDILSCCSSSIKEKYFLLCLYFLISTIAKSSVPTPLGFWLLCHCGRSGGQAGRLWDWCLVEKKGEWEEVGDEETEEKLKNSSAMRMNTQDSCAQTATMLFTAVWSLKSYLTSVRSVSSCEMLEIAIIIEIKLQ